MTEASVNHIPCCWNCGRDPEGRIMITIEEASCLCSVSVKTIYRWMELFKVDWLVTAGGRRRIYRDSLLGFGEARIREEEERRQEAGGRRGPCISDSVSGDPNGFEVTERKQEIRGISEGGRSTAAAPVFSLLSPVSLGSDSEFPTPDPSLLNDPEGSADV